MIDFRDEELKKIILLNYVTFVVNLGFPLLILKHVYSVLGIIDVGTYAFAQSISALANIFVDYGYSLLGVKFIANDKGNISRNSRYYSDVFYHKLLISITLLGFFWLLSRFSSFFGENGLIFFLLLSSNFISFLIPNYLFQGMERMKEFTLFNTLVKLVSLFAVVFWVKQPGDLIIFSLVLLLSNIILLFISVNLVKFKFGIRLLKFNLNAIRCGIVENFKYFQSTLLIGSYTSFVPFYLGSTASLVEAGYFFSAERVVLGFRSIYSPISQALFPYINRDVTSISLIDIKDVKRSLAKIASLTLILSLLLFLLADCICSILYQDQNSDRIVFLIKIMSPLPLIVSINNFLGNNVLISLGMQVEFRNALVVSSTVSLIVSMSLIPIFESLGTSIAVVFSEVLITLLFVKIVYRKLSF